MGTVRILFSLLLSLCMVVTSFASTKAPYSALEAISNFRTYGEVLNYLEKHRTEDAAFLKNVMKEHKLNLDSEVIKFSVKGKKVFFADGTEAEIDDGIFSVTYQGKKQSFVTSQSLKEIMSHFEKKTSFSPFEMIFPSAYAYGGALMGIIIAGIFAIAFSLYNSEKLKEASELGNLVCSNFSKVQAVEIEDAKEHYNKLSDLNKEYCLNVSIQNPHRTNVCSELRKVMTCFREQIARAPAVDSSGRDTRKDNIYIPSSDTFKKAPKASKQ